MAAGGSKLFRSNRRGATTGQGATIRREGQAPLPSLEIDIPAAQSLEEICVWLGTFRERLRLARAEDRAGVQILVEQLEARFQVRRAELS